MNDLKNDSGQAMVLVMMVITVILLVSSSMLSQCRESRKASFEERKMIQAGYIAEAGAEKAIAKIKNDPGWLKDLAFDHTAEFIGSPVLAYAGGQITGVTIKRTSSTTNPTTFAIESLGQYQGAKRTVEVSGEMYDPAGFPKEAWLGKLDKKWYAENADRELTNVLSGSFNVDGISFVSGNIDLSGNYSGSGVIVAGGKATISGNLYRENENASLAVIAFGDPVGIETGNNLVIEALFYTPCDVFIGDDTHLNGIATCRRVVTGLNASIAGDEVLQEKHPKWITTIVKITSWKEKYSVF